MGQVVEFTPKGGEVPRVTLFEVHAIASTELVRYHILKYDEDDKPDYFVLVSQDENHMINRYISVYSDGEKVPLIGYLLHHQEQACPNTADEVALRLFREQIQP